MGQLRESLEIEQQALYCSSAYLTSACALSCLQHHISQSLNSAPYFSASCIKKICAFICNHVIEAWESGTAKEYTWYGKEGHCIDNCFCIGLCHHCLYHRYTRVECKHPYDMCLEGSDCKVSPTHPNFKCRYCTAVDDCIDV